MTNIGRRSKGTSVQRLHWIGLAGLLSFCRSIGRSGVGSLRASRTVWIVSARLLAEQAVVADAVEALGQDVDQEPADELVRVERHRLVAAGSLDPVVLDLERHRPRVDRDQAAVGDRDPMGVARQIGEHRLGAGERALGIDEPALLSERGKERCERLGIYQMCMGAENFH